MKRTAKKLRLSTSTVRDLSGADLQNVRGAERGTSPLSDCPLNPGSACWCPPSRECSIIGSGCISCFTCYNAGC